MVVFFFARMMCREEVSPNSSLTRRESLLRSSGQPQQGRCPWTGGQGTDPNEQNTQQSPGLARNSVLQPSHSQKNRQASVGIVSRLAWPQ